MQPSSALLAPGFCPCCCSGSFLSQKIDEKKRLQESISAHKTGLPDRILRLFAPRPPLPHSEGKRKRPPPVPLSGIAQYVDRFAKPGDPEYEPPPPETRPPEPRIFRNPELGTQARVDIETKLEKWVLTTVEMHGGSWGVAGAAGWCAGCRLRYVLLGDVVAARGSQRRCRAQYIWVLLCCGHRQWWHRGWAWGRAAAAVAAGGN